MSDEHDIPKPVEVTLCGHTYVLSPVPARELGDAFPLLQQLTALDRAAEREASSFNVNPILRAAAEQLVLCALKPIYLTLPSNALRAVPGDELLKAVDLTLGLSGRIFEGIELDEED